MSEASFEPFATDNYFEQYVYEKPTVLSCKVKFKRHYSGDKGRGKGFILPPLKIRFYCVTKSMKKAGKKRFVGRMAVNCKPRFPSKGERQIQTE